MAGKKPSLSIGRLRNRVDLQSATVTRDSGGGVTEAFTTIAQIYADIRPTGGDESYRQGKVKDTVTHKIYCRFRSDISPEYSIVYESRIFQIKNIINIDERDRWLELTCSEGVAA